MLLKTPSIQASDCSCSQGLHLARCERLCSYNLTQVPHAHSLTMAALLQFSSHSFFSCGPSDRSSKDRGMFDGLLDSRRPENTSPGETPTLSLICHPMQVGFFFWFVLLLFWSKRSFDILIFFAVVTKQLAPSSPAGPADQRESLTAPEEDAFRLSARREDGRGLRQTLALPLLRQ